jgi:hypothetical protein
VRTLAKQHFTFALVILALLMGWSPAHSNPLSPSMSVAELLDVLQGPEGDTDPQLAACCKMCSKGKACGDSCIAQNKRCSKGPGCACDQ